jgi:hypothetical protein
MGALGEVCDSRLLTHFPGLADEGGGSLATRKRHLPSACAAFAALITVAAGSDNGPQEIELPP